MTVLLRQLSKFIAADLVSVVFKSIMGREIDDSGRQTYVECLCRDGDLGAVLRALIASEEEEKQIFASEHHKY